MPLSLGHHTLMLSVDDGNGGTDTDVVEVTVEDTTPPEISLALLTETLWPVNHEMVLVATGISASDVCDEFPVLTIAVTISETDGPGDGDTETDLEVVSNGDGTFDVWARAERSGTGTGRVYTITATATDVSQNETVVTADVTVPHDRRGGADEPRAPSGLALVSH